MSFKSTVFLILTIFISACASTNTKNDSSSSSPSVADTPLVTKGEIVFEKEALNLDKSEVAFIFIKDKFTSVREINGKKVHVPFFGKWSRKFVTLPGAVSISFDYGIDTFLGLSTWEAKLEAGKTYVFDAREGEGEDVIYFGLYDVESKKIVGGF